MTHQMSATTITRLNQLNLSFYQTVHEPFSQSRSAAWEGWDQVFSREFFTNFPDAIRVLDIGCGNGRLGVFLSKIHGERLEYIGVDQSPELLAVARESLQRHTISHHLQPFDLVTQAEALLQLFPQTFEVVTVFGVLHHIPSHTLREKVFKVFSRLLSPKGKLVFTTWRFLDNERLKAKLVSPEKLGLAPESLEENDYLMDWQRGTTAYRYCHYLDQAEVEALVQKAGLKIETHFLADGHDHQTNAYYIASRV